LRWAILDHVDISLFSCAETSQTDRNRQTNYNPNECK
jgi:hypothetical protein